MLDYNQFQSSLAIIDRAIFELKQLYANLDGKEYQSYVVYNMITEQIKIMHEEKRKFLAQHNIAYNNPDSYVDA